MRAALVFGGALLALGLSACGVQRLGPELGTDKEAVRIPHAPTIAIDGDAADWASVPALPAPFSRKQAGMLKLAWGDAGLYGMLQVKDARVTADAFSPWTKDCLELWIESDAARSYDMSDHAWQIAFAPNPDAGPGRAIVCAANGKLDRDQVQASWKPIDGGYALEFLIPAAQLKLAMTPGARIGLNYAVDDDSVAIEEFYADKDMDMAFASPCRWGLATLAP